MKVHRKRIRLLKGLAIAGCAIGLAVPSVAGAMPADGPFRQGGDVTADQQDRLVR